MFCFKHVVNMLYTVMFITCRQKPIIASGVNGFRNQVHIFRLVEKSRGLAKIQYNRNLYNTGSRIRSYMYL